MYRVLIADDEGIAIDSLTFLLEKNFHDRCEVRSARSGRAVIELAESFRPDIAVMDIQMPGINGIEAIREIRKFSPATIFIVVTAYDKFDYAKQAIDLNVMCYLTKPLERDVFVDTINKAISQIDRLRERRRTDLRNWEKLESVVPVIESGLIYSLLLQDDAEEDTINHYRSLLELNAESGYVLLIECGDNMQLDNPIGTGIRIQEYYSRIREIIKEFNSSAVIGQIMMNKIPVLIPHDDAEPDYNERIGTIDRVRLIVSQLEEKTGVSFRVGIGRVRPLHDMKHSYQEAMRSLSAESGPVAHADDLPVACEYEGDYPLDIEKDIFDNLKRGNVSAATDAADRFFSWMENSQVTEHEENVRLKALEFVLWAEHVGYENGGLGLYRFTDRGDYLRIAVSYDIPALHRWFVARIQAAAEKIASKTKNQTDSLIGRARTYIDSHYQNDISLDDVSRAINISPYYFSKLFKEESGVTFIEYLTNLRISRAKQLLADPDVSIRDIGSAVGYQDPNYFSRIFRRATGVSPSEYRSQNPPR